MFKWQHVFRFCPRCGSNDLKVRLVRHELCPARPVTVCSCAKCCGKICSVSGTGISPLQTLEKRKSDSYVMLQSSPCGSHKQCQSCDHIHYPPLYPTIITLIQNRAKDALLLANHKRQPQRGMYTCIAGFMESGEKHWVINCIVCLEVALCRFYI